MYRLNGKKQKTSAQVSKMLYKNKIATNPNQISNMMNDYFCHVGENLVKEIPDIGKTHMQYMRHSVQNSIYLEPITRAELLLLIENLNLHKSSGADNIGPKIIKEAASLLIDPILYIFNKSFEYGIVPDQLKLAKVIPIYKKGNKDSPSNYRPI